MFNTMMAALEGIAVYINGVGMVSGIGMIGLVMIFSIVFVTVGVLFRFDPQMQRRV